jgi:hypothetical protein
MHENDYSPQGHGDTGERHFTTESTEKNPTYDGEDGAVEVQLRATHQEEDTADTEERQNQS